MRQLALFVAAALSAAPALALEYVSVAEAAAMYDAPSQKARPIFAVAAGTPLEVVVSLDPWIKVRDSKGSLAWMEKKSLSTKRTVMVKVDRAEVRAQPDEKAPLVFEAARDVVLDWIEAGPPGWVHVRHRDGQSGFVKVTQVWGL